MGFRIDLRSFELFYVLVFILGCEVRGCRVENYKKSIKLELREFVILGLDFL